jgi:hypothetical protein
MDRIITLVCMILRVGLLFGIILINPALSEETSPEYDDSIACYEGGDELVKPEFVVQNLLVTANVYATEADLIEAVEAMGYSTVEDLELSECEIHPDQNIGWCEIWVVMPTKVLGDPNMDAIGHEVAHGLFGDFHE